jgi:uncharacterized cysteine cluster protein YcgN (CxxCxxCC family)
MEAARRANLLSGESVSSTDVLEDSSGCLELFCGLVISLSLIRASIRVVNSDEGSVMKDTYACRIYEQRPAHCRKYPWEAAQILFEECVFVSDGKIQTFDETVTQLGYEAVESKCRECGRCCFSWQIGADGEKERVGVCCHLESREEDYPFSPQLVVLDISCLT